MTYYITTSRPYTNATPHLGTIMDPIYADVYKRLYDKLHNYDTFFSMGTDEHSSKIVDKAVELGITPKNYVDNQYKIFKDAFDALDINYDNFLQNSEKKHIFISNLIWRKMAKRGYIYKKTYEGLYCKGCEDFYSASQLNNGKCPIHYNLEIQHVQEENYFFKLTSFGQQLENYLKQVKINDESVRKEMLNFIQDLQDISISRDKKRLQMDWGVTIADDPSQIMYVWFEALITYLTPLVDEELFQNWLEGDSDIKNSVEGEIWAIFEEKLPQNLQIIGRDNIKFHLIIWPAMLFALDLQPIDTMLVHGMINDKEGRKFAKSAGNGVSFDDIYKEYGSEGVRFFVLYYCNSCGDTNYDSDKLRELYNAVLANNLGNLLTRLTTLIEKHLDGDVVIHEENCLNIDLQTSYEYLYKLQPELACQHIFKEISKINVYLQDTKPWELAKDLDKNLEQIRSILTDSLSSLNICLPILGFFMPKTVETINNIIINSNIRKASPLFNKKEKEEKKIDNI
jgi:methionyl-tRNA synthetase